MQFPRRRVLAAATTALAGGTLAAATLWRKPAPAATPDLSTTYIGQLVVNTAPASPNPANFTDADGTTRTLSSYAGQGLVVNLWATWCAPCVAEMPALQAFAQAVAKDGILVLPLSSDRGGAQAVRTFYAAHAITALPVMLDPRGEAGRNWGARGLPTTLIIDRAGRERARLEGAHDWTNPDTMARIRRLVG